MLHSALLTMERNLALINVPSGEEAVLDIMQNQVDLLVVDYRLPGINGIELIRKLQHDHGTSVIFITHDLGVLASVSDRIIVMYAGQIMEAATTSDVFYDPQHPYTYSLMKSIPATHEKGEDLFTIPGLPPDLMGDATGCPFAPRCGHAVERCHTTPMDLVATGDGHTSACLRIQKKEIHVGDPVKT